jgi:excisionase family DNA binding protein
MARTLMTADQVHRLIGLPKATIWSLARARRIPVVVIGRLYRFDPVALERWIDAGGEVGALPPATAPSSTGQGSSNGDSPTRA